MILCVTIELPRDRRVREEVGLGVGVGVGVGLGVDHGYILSDNDKKSTPPLTFFHLFWHGIYQPRSSGRGKSHLSFQYSLGWGLTFQKDYVILYR